MNFVNTWRERFSPVIEWCGDISLLLLRLWLANEFLYAAYHKLGGGLTPPEWFTGLTFPIPFSLFPSQLNWVMVGVTELVCGLAILFGLWARLNALVLLIVTYVAVYSVHFDLGWSGWNQIETEEGYGFKVPLMIGIMLFTVVGQGAGRWSVDRWLRQLGNKGSRV